MEIGNSAIVEIHKQGTKQERHLAALRVKTKQENLAYMAGFIDGEGSINIAKVVQKRLKTPIYKIALQVANTSPIAIYELKIMFGGSIVIDDANKDKGCKPVYHYVSSGRNAYNALLSLLPHLKQKAPQARLAIKFWEQMRRYQVVWYGKAKGGKGLGSSATLPDEVARREALYQEMHQLNKRGASRA